MSFCNYVLAHVERGDIQSLFESWRVEARLMARTCQVTGQNHCQIGLGALQANSVDHIDGSFFPLSFFVFFFKVECGS